MMRRLKNGLILLLTVLLLAAVALLPRAAAELTDRDNLGVPGTAEIRQISLDLSGDRAGEPGYMMGRLALEQRMMTIPVEPAQAVMTEQEVFDAAVMGMEPYVEAGLFSWFGYEHYSAEPYLGIDPQDKDNYAIFWGVRFTRTEEPYHDLFLHLDDETGRITFVIYETYDKNGAAYASPSANAEKEDRLRSAGALAEAFLSPLELTVGQLGEYRALASADENRELLTGEVGCVGYTYEDERYGTIYIEFYIIPSGFYVTFPQS